MDECGEKNAISLSWGRREIRISGEGATLYVNGVPHDMTMMLETIRGAGARPERISPARWISLLRGRPTVLPGCESPCNLQIFLCLFLEKLNMPQNTPVTKAS